jgi:hypothetical protein
MRLTLNVNHSFNIALPSDWAFATLRAIEKATAKLLGALGAARN